MSVEYDRYLSEHIANVNRGLHWMLDNMPEDEIDREALEEAISNSHDASKYDKDEYEAYDAYFYGGNRSYKVVKDFDYAWLNHIHKNPHHWQYWILIEDDPVTGSIMKPLEMPLVYIYEMIADWWSFSWKDGNPFGIFKWYNEHHEKQYLEAKTLLIVRTLLGRMWQIWHDHEMFKDQDMTVIEKEYMPYWIAEPKEEDEEDEDHIEHHGIIGQKWGVRRFQNADGTLTEAGKKRYGKKLVDTYSKLENEYDKLNGFNLNSSPRYKKTSKEAEELRKEILSSSKEVMKVLDKAKKLDQDEDFDKIYDLRNDFKKAAEKTYRSILEAYGDVNVKYMPSSNETMLDVMLDKAGYDDYYDLLWSNQNNEEELKLAHSDTEEDEHKFGVPEQKKFPLPDADHVKSAIRFFNYVDPKYEKELAKAILERAKEYGVVFGEDINVGDENKFKKYLPEEHLEHHGILGQKWGVRRYQNKDGTLTEEGKKRYLNSEGLFMYPKDKNGRQIRSRKDMRVYSNYLNTLEKETEDEYNSIRKLKKDSKERLKAENDYLTSATKEYPNEKDIARYYTLLNKIYNVDDMSFKSKDIENTKDPNERTRLVLKEIDFSDTKENRENARWIWAYD